MADKAIWKYPLPTPRNPIVISMPLGAQILSVQVQYDVPTIWALVEPGNVLCDRIFYAVNTGFEFDDTGMVYVATVQLHGGSFVKHLYEKVQS